MVYHERNMILDMGSSTHSSLNAIKYCVMHAYYVSSNAQATYLPPFEIYVRRLGAPRVPLILIAMPIKSSDWWVRYRKQRLRARRYYTWMSQIINLF